MTALAILHDLERQGVRITADGGNLRISAQRGTLTPVLLARVKSAKPEILAELAQSGKPEAASLAEQLRAEVAIMRRDDNEDWLSWSAPCRARWAALMLGLACELNVTVDSPDRDWLGRLADGYVE